MYRRTSARARLVVDYKGYHSDHDRAPHDGALALASEVPDGDGVPRQVHALRLLRAPGASTPRSPPSPPSTPCGVGRAVERRVTMTKRAPGGKKTTGDRLGAPEHPGSWPPPCGIDPPGRRRLSRYLDLLAASNGRRNLTGALPSRGGAAGGARASGAGPPLAPVPPARHRLRQRLPGPGGGAALRRICTNAPGAARSAAGLSCARRHGPRAGSWRCGGSATTSATARRGDGHHAGASLPREGAATLLAGPAGGCPRRPRAGPGARLVVRRPDPRAPACTSRGPR